MSEESKKLSLEYFNRVSVWAEALGKAYTYLLSIEDLKELNHGESEYVKYQIGDRWANFHKGFTINSALLEAAIINFKSVFSSGYPGNKIAANTDEEINKLREEIIEKSIHQLKWTRDEFDQVFDRIKLQRDGLLAHYDGNVGNYEEVAEGLSSRKMVGAHLFPDEIDKFKRLVNILHENAFKLAYSS